ncbi:MAG: hypothetical protein KGK02_10745 [Rhodospirillales bacterium]|nr:hypothetical protein [Rhodospirillales bacterium]
MDFHLNRRVVLSQESKYESLYKWSLQEHDDNGNQIGRDQVPCSWSLVFTVTEVALYEELNLEVKTPLFARLKPDEHKDGIEEQTTTEEKKHIRAELRPGYFTDPDGGARYSMFGTDRAIKSFQLLIYKREDETKPEQGHAWGALSYATEIDFRNETADDTLQFYLHVSAERFAKYIEMVRGSSSNIIALRLTMVDGFYSEWSPSITADRIKVLTNLKDHQVTIPDGCAITPPTLGRVGKFSLTFVTRGVCDQPPQEIEPDDDGFPDSIVEKVQPSGEESLLLQRAALKLATQQEQRIKYLSYAAWLVVGLLVLLILRR